jgi:hypothetical protein
VFSLPNLFVLAPLLALDLVGVVRGRQRVALRVAGEAVAGAIALVHYVIFVRPQGAVASQGFWSGNFAPHAPGAFLWFTARGIGSYFPTVVTGVAGADPAAVRVLSRERHRVRDHRPPDGPASLPQPLSVAVMARSAQPGQRRIEGTPVPGKVRS